MTNENKKLEILVVDDREENREAAKKYFSTRKEVNVDFAETYNDGLKKLNEKVYAFGIFDIELPKNKAEKPERLGYGLGDEADKQSLDYVLITSGLDHHHVVSAYVQYSFEDKELERKQNMKKSYDDAKNRNDKFAMQNVLAHSTGRDIELIGFKELTETPKNSPNAWKQVYETLIAECPNAQAIFESKKRYFKNTGKMYQREK